MENASKALLIAGGVLITILVVSLGVYFAQYMAGENSRMYAQLEEHNRTEFNQQFLNYNGRSDLNIQDIVTIINLAKDSNKENDLEDMTSPTIADIANEKSLYVKVSIPDIGGKVTGDGDSKDDAEKIIDENELLKNIMQDPTLYSINYICKVTVNSNTGYVNYIKITKP